MRLIPLIAFCLAAPALAQAPAAPAPRRPINLPGVSPAGNAILTRLDQQGDPALVQLLRQQKNARDQLANAIMVPAIDVDRVSTLMKQLDLLQSQIRARSSDRVLTALKALGDADRGPFLRAIANSVGRPAN